MSPEERELLNRSVALAEDNNKMLHSMHKGMRRASIARAIYWIFIIGAAVLGYYLIQPYTDEVMKMYKDAQKSFSNFSTTIQKLNK